MRLLQIFLVAVCLCFIAPAAFAAPQLLEDSFVQDFGQLTQGAKIELLFRFQNVGDEPLQVGRIRVSCGCTAAMLSSHRLAPGAIGELRVGFNSQGMRGTVEKEIILESNDPALPEAVFVIRGEVVSQLSVEPQRINWTAASPRETFEQQLILTSTSPTAVQLQLETTSTAFQVSPKAAQIAAAGTLQITVRATFPAEKKRLAGYLLIHTDNPSQPQIRIPLKCTFKSSG